MVWGMLSNAARRLKPSPAADAGREEAVRDGLREQVGEFLRRQRADKVFPERVEEAAQHAWLVRLVVVLVAHDVAEQAGALGQLDGEGFGGERLGQGKIKEALKEGRKLVRPFPPAAPFATG